MRLEEESAVVRDAISAEYADIIVAVTELGSPTTLLVLLAVLFWCGSRRRSALVISYGVAGLGFMLALETLLGLPRPPESRYLTSVDVEGYGFPSGHAFASVVVYGGLVSVYGRLRDPIALLSAGTLVAAVSLSRVVLGVHYLGDVIVGATLGVAFVAAMNRICLGVPTVGFAVAAALAVPAVYVTGAAAYALLALGAAIGGLLTAGWIDRLPRLRSRLEGLVLVVVGVTVIVALRIVETVVDLTPSSSPSTPCSWRGSCSPPRSSTESEGRSSSHRVRIRETASGCTPRTAFRTRSRRVARWSRYRTR